MKRRDAVYTITLSITGVASLTHCTSSPSEKSKIDHKDKELINSISKAILPLKSESFKTPESRIEFILNQVEGGLNGKEIEKYKSGLLNLKNQITTSNPAGFDFLNFKIKNQILLNALDSENDIGFFMRKTRQWSLRHFMTSEEFMTKYLKYEFIPGRHLGCVPI
tara:strand:- start:4903 stop:5397 length:495 start_codon:yes stop_codon:yes gene_type:complete